MVNDGEKGGLEVGKRGRMKEGKC